MHLTTLGLIIGYIAGFTAVSFILAQLTDFGLGQFHVQSGILGPFLLIYVAEVVIAYGVKFGGAGS